MSVPTAYIGVIMIWTTTPLAIKWSSEGAGFLFGVTARMLLGMFVCLVLVALLSRRMRWNLPALLTYVAAGLGIWGAMTAVYWAAQFIPSGMISVLFGFTPVVTSLMASLWLGERVFTPFKILGMLLGIAGLGVIFWKNMSFADQTLLGGLAVLGSVTIHSISTVWVKRINANLHPLEVTTGALLIAVPLYLFVWWGADAQLPQLMDSRTMWAIIYLGIVGSALGFILYYYVLKQVEANKVALITLVTPVLALLLGQVINNESTGTRVWIGTLIILTGLMSYQWDKRGADTRL